MFNAFKSTNQADSLSPKGWKMSFAILLFIVFVLLMMVSYHGKKSNKIDFSKSEVGVISYPDAISAINRPIELTKKPSGFINPMLEPIQEAVVHHTQSGFWISNRDGEVGITLQRPLNDLATPQLEINATVEDGRYIVESLHIRFKREH